MAGVTANADDSPHASNPFGSLTGALRESTRDLHLRAERAGIMQAVLRGSVDRASYVGLLSSLRTIYVALERALSANAARAEIAPILLPGLFRCGAIDGDLAALSADARPGTSEVPRAYAARLALLSETDPARLIAHAWVRYLGDLSGGQILKRVVGSNPALGVEATRFYDFGSPQTARDLAARLRAAIDSTETGRSRRDALIDEARWAFEAHVALFEELDAVSQRPDPASPAHAPTTPEA